LREDAAGRPVSFTLLYNSDNKLREAIAALLQDDLAKVGIRMIPTGLDFSTVVTRTRHDLQYEACLGGLGSAVPADPGMGPNFWKSTGITHFWDVRQPAGRPDTPAEARMNALFDAHVATTDLAQRRAAFREMSAILNEECFVVWLPTVVLRIPVSSRFGNVHPSPMPHRILWNADRIFRRDAAGTR
jgi:ABC-type transport system substrate-binding protein